jgi:hypothetical protein
MLFSAAEQILDVDRTFREAEGVPKGKGYRRDGLCGLANFSRCWGWVKDFRQDRFTRFGCTKSWIARDLPEKSFRNAIANRRAKRKTVVRFPKKQECKECNGYDG